MSKLVPFSHKNKLAGVKKKDINLDLNDGRLTIGVAEKLIAEEDKKKLIHR